MFIEIIFCWGLALSQCDFLRMIQFIMSPHLTSNLCRSFILFCMMTPFQFNFSCLFFRVLKWECTISITCTWRFSPEKYILSQMIYCILEKCFIFYFFIEKQSLFSYAINSTITWIVWRSENRFQDLWDILLCIFWAQKNENEKITIVWQIRFIFSYLRMTNKTL